MALERARLTRNPAKRLLIDDIVRERNAFAKEIMQDVQAQREELAVAAGEGRLSGLK